MYRAKVFWKDGTIDIYTISIKKLELEERNAVLYKELAVQLSAKGKNGREITRIEFLEIVDYEKLTDQQLYDQMFYRFGFALFKEVNEFNRNTLIGLLKVFEDRDFASRT